MTNEKELMEEFVEKKQTVRKTNPQNPPRKTRTKISTEPFAPFEPVKPESTSLGNEPRNAPKQAIDRVGDAPKEQGVHANLNTPLGRKTNKPAYSRNNRRPVNKNLETTSLQEDTRQEALEVQASNNIDMYAQENSANFAQENATSSGQAPPRHSRIPKNRPSGQKAPRKNIPSLAINQPQLTHIDRKSLGVGENKEPLEEYDISATLPQVMAPLELIPASERQPNRRYGNKKAGSALRGNGANSTNTTNNVRPNKKNHVQIASTNVLTAIMEEAPIAILSEEISIVERSNEQSKRSRNRKTKQRPEQEVKMNPIAEGGDLALIEAGQIVKQAKNKKTAAPKEATERMLYISRESDEQVEVVITEKGIIAEYFVEMVHQTKIRGNIYKGIVNNIDSNLQAAFVNFGTGKNGFLQIDEIHSEYWNAPHLEGSKYPPIQKAIKIGQEILVQVVKEPSGNKGAFLTTWVSIAGRFLVLTPGQEQIGVSRKVTDHEERARLKDLLSGINPGDDLGVIIRTVSEGASKVSIKKDLQYLKRIWKDISRKIAKQKSPSIVYQEADLAFRSIRDYLSENIREIWVDSPEILNSLKPFISLVLPKKLDILKLHENKTKNIWETFNLVSQLDEVTKREVNLPSGGRLVFDQTEALMAIDINSGKTHGKINFENMVFRTNMEAAESIARHLRMRDVGGQVVIDFIEMKDRGHVREVEKTLRDAMHGDKARHDIGSISSFGLLELVRQRTGSSAISLSSEPCPHCQGTGFRRNMEWQAQKMLRELKNKLLLKKNEGTYVYEIENEVGLYILNRKRDRLSELEEQFQIKLEIRLR